METVIDVQSHLKYEETGRFSDMAEGLSGSEILKIASEIRMMVSQGQKVCNLTVGDFSPTEFRIPIFLEEAIHRHYRNGQTNYPPFEGVMELRTAIRKFYIDRFQLDYPEKSIIVCGGARPIIYSLFRTVVSPGDKVIFPTPSWNNHYYTHMLGANGIAIPCHADNAFLPTRDLLKDRIKDARLITLNSPLNPTGTAFTREALEGICDLVLEENRRRNGKQGPLYVLFDQIYWMLTFGSTTHFNPVSLRPELAPYVIFVDGISKAFAATGVRVGWSTGPDDIIQRMSAMLTHVGAWAPRAEQMATADLLMQPAVIEEYHKTMKTGLETRLDMLHKGISELACAGFPVQSIVPMGAIYLTAQFDLIGKKNPRGGVFTSNEEIRQYLLQEAKFGVVHFQAFGYEGNTGWFRLSVGAISVQDITDAFPRLKAALEKVK